MNQKVRCIFMILIVFMVGVLLTYIATYKATYNFESRGKFETFIRRCTEISREPYLVLRDDIKDFYFRCTLNP